ncbi:MAG: hypothetical protein GXP29_03205 [Planctomycetes bacterium]|nr:hypothetical protein [Planctomycetota bacterium]
MSVCLLLGATGCDSNLCGLNQLKQNEVIVMGMIHGGHRDSDAYGIPQIQDYVRRIKPDFILVEIPPDRFDTALKQFRETGTITESRVRVFPEYTDAIFPIMDEVGFEIIPCAGWTKTMADNRRDNLREWKTTRAGDYKEMSDAQNQADATITAEKLDDDPAGIHSDRYDEIVRQGMEPYNRLFNDDLGDGGWDNINAAHFGHIEDALNAHRNEGKRFLITFGAWHKYWFLAKLRQRTDIKLIDLTEFTPATESTTDR